MTPHYAELLAACKQPNGPRGSDLSQALGTTPVVHPYFDGPADLILGRLVFEIDNWGRNRQLVREHGCTALSQMKKLREEMQEIEDAILEGNEVKIVDGIGDTLTVLIQIMRLTEVPMIEALERAWSEIRYRKGKMIDGIFVKQSDLDKMEGETA